MVAVQIGYTISDVISKCGVGYLVYRIGLAKSKMEKRAAYRGISVEELEEMESSPGGTAMAVFKADISDQLTNFETRLKEIQVTQESMQFAQKEILRVVNPEAFHELEAAEAARLEEAAREEAARLEEAAREAAGEEETVEVDDENEVEEKAEEADEEEQDDTEKDEAEKKDENEDENEEESLLST